MKTYVIPVAFEVEGETELEAAHRLARVLGERAVKDQDGIESWQMQNHPIVDGSDNEGVIVFFPLPRWPTLPGETPSEAMQRTVDWFLSTTKEWLKPNRDE